MNFREETESINGEIIKKYYIDNKPVDEKTYFENTDKLYSNIIPKENDCSQRICTCNTCLYFLDLIHELRELEDKDAAQLLQDEVEIMVHEAFMRGQCEALNDLGKSLLKQATKIEVDLESIYDDNIDE